MPTEIETNLWVAAKSLKRSLEPATISIQESTTHGSLNRQGRHGKNLNFDEEYLGNSQCYWQKGSKQYSNNEICWREHHGLDLSGPRATIKVKINFHVLDLMFLW